MIPENQRHPNSIIRVIRLDGVSTTQHYMAGPIKDGPIQNIIYSGISCMHDVREHVHCVAYFIWGLGCTDASVLERFLIMCEKRERERSTGAKGQEGCKTRDSRYTIKAFPTGTTGVLNSEFDGSINLFQKYLCL